MTRAAGWWRRLSGWVAKKDRETRKEGWEPEGLDLAEEALRSELFQSAFQKRHLLNPPIIVSDEDFVVYERATELLSLGWPGLQRLHWLKNHGFLTYGYRASDGREGLTRQSVQAERAWRESASRWDLAKRALGELGPI